MAVQMDVELIPDQAKIRLVFHEGEHKVWIDLNAEALDKLMVALANVRPVITAMEAQRGPAAVH